jgi:hypothetical protein
MRQPIRLDAILQRLRQTIVQLFIGRNISVGQRIRQPHRMPRDNFIQRLLKKRPQHLIAIRPPPIPRRLGKFLSKDLIRRHQLPKNLPQIQPQPILAQ